MSECIIEALLVLVQWGRGQYCASDRHQIGFGFVEFAHRRPLVFLVQQPAGTVTGN